MSVIAADTTSLTWGQSLTALIVIAGVILLIGIIVAASRGRPSKRQPGDSIVRSWLAISLVSALILLAALTFALTDSNSRSTLIGGVAASAGAAIAFYFSSKASDQAREDILAATFGRESAPDLTGKTLAEATKIVSRSSLKLQVASPTDATDDMVVQDQTPAAAAEVPKGSVVAVVLTAPPGQNPPPQ
jgi:PASTA domain